jgi:DNA-binding winged helix-turn-helix (wHTH) protein/tetratricopeptide (TPR) repeat protein
MDETRPLSARFGPFRIDEAEARLERDEGVVELPPRAFQVLCALVRRPGQLVTKDALLDAVWGHRHINESALKNIISQLRLALGDDARESRFIQTASRRGYRFIAPVVDDVAVQDRGARTERSQPNATTPATTALAGRDVPLAHLQRVGTSAQGGLRNLVFVVGDAGIGKSTLVERFVAGSNFAVAFGQCIEHYGSGEPYMPVLEALNALCHAEGGTVVVDAMRRIAPTWLLQLPWFLGSEDRRDLQRETSGATQDRMLREFGELIEHVAADRPVLLVLEDLHWSDHATVQLLGYLARRRRPASIMVLGTFRPTELIIGEHPLAALRQDLRSHRLCTEIDLESFSEADVGDYLEARFGKPVPEAFVQALHAHTYGLPLFVVNVVDELVTSAKLRRVNDAWQYPDSDLLALPRSIVGVIEAQVARLTPQQQRTLGAASVAGLEFLHVPLAQVLQMQNAEVEALLEAASGRIPWLRCVGATTLNDDQIAARYAFAHTMYRDVLYERIAAPQKLLWHRRWAVALLAQHGANASEVAAELALHFERANEPIAAAKQLAVVAARAQSRGAAHEALQAARHALKLGNGVMDAPLELELRVLEAVALTRLYVVSEPEVAAAFERARALDAVDSPAWPHALHGSWWVYFARGDLATARSHAAQMLELAEGRDDPAWRLTSLNAMGMTEMMMGRLFDARAKLEAALEIHAALGTELPPTRFVQDPGSEAIAALALVCWLGGQPERGRLLAQRAPALAVANEHPLSEIAALYVAAMLHALAGEFDAVHELTERLYGVMREHVVPERRSGFAWLHGRALVARGQIGAGLEEMRTALRSALDLGMRFSLCDFHYHYADACAAAGQDVEACTSIEAGLALAQSGVEQLMLSPLLRQHAQWQARRGDTAATATFARAIRIAREQGAAFHEIAALASAQRVGSTAADRGRLHELLLLYADDTSPVICAARAALS